MAEYKKVTKWERFKGWCDDHAIEIIFGGTLALSAITGVIIGHEFGKQKGYRKGISDLAGQVPTIMDVSGSVGAQALFDALCDQADKSGHEEYCRTLENLDQDRAGREAYHRFHEDEGIKDLLRQMDDAKNGNW